jgi:hypothetical protein
MTITERKFHVSERGPNAREVGEIVLPQLELERAFIR